MLLKEFLLVLLIGSLLQESWSRTVSITLNLNLDLAKNERSKVSADMVQNCMKRTEVAMNELTRFRLGLGPNSSPLEATASEEDAMLSTAEDDDAENKENYVDYSGLSTASISEKFQEPVQCFAHCLYEQMGLIKDGVFMENEVQRKLYVFMVREQVQLPECMNMGSDNICDAAYKLHLCYSKLRMLESESRMKALVDHMESADDKLKMVADAINAAVDAEEEEEEEGKENEIVSL